MEKTEVESSNDNPPPYSTDYYSESASSPPPPPSASAPAAAASAPSAPLPPVVYPGQVQQVVVVGPDGEQQYEDEVPLIQSYTSHILLACFTTWCCGCICGLAAFALAVMAQNKSTSPNAQERFSAMQLGRASYRLSVAGIITGVIAFIIWLIMHVTASNYNQY